MATTTTTVKDVVACVLRAFAWICGLGYDGRDEARNELDKFALLWLGL
jgi:hypothetical protein